MEPGQEMLALLRQMAEDMRAMRRTLDALATLAQDQDERRQTTVRAQSYRPPEPFR